MSRHTVSDAIISDLAALGVDAVFGITSIHNLPIYDALHRHGGFRVVTARSEGGAVNMADAYARVSGRLGVVLTSTGTGAGNGAGALIEAATAGSPLLHITGQVDSVFIESGRGYIHEFEGQLPMLKALSKQAFRVRRAPQALTIVRTAISRALDPPSGPVSVEIPIDFQAQTVERSKLVWSRRPQRVPDPEQVQAVVEKLVIARRPLMWAGGGVIRADAAPSLRELAESLDAGVITSQAGRGAIPEDHPLCIGHFATYPEVIELLASSDLLLSVGVRFRGNETSNWTMTVPAEHIGIDVDAAAINRNFPHSESLVGDAAILLPALVKALGRRRAAAKPDFHEEVESVRTAVRQRLRDTLGPWETLLDAVREGLPEEAIVVRDITIPNTTWGNRLIEILRPRTSVHASGGGIGQGLSMATGAQIAAPDSPVVLFCGDGGFLLKVGDLATVREERLPVVIVLYDDSGYGVIRNIQDQYLDGRKIGADLWTPDFVQLGKAFGIQTHRVESADALGARLGEAIAAREARLIVVDSDAIGPMAKPFSGPPGAGRLLQPHD